MLVTPEPKVLLDNTPTPLVLYVLPVAILQSDVLVTPPADNAPVQVMEVGVKAPVDRVPDTVALPVQLIKNKIIQQLNNYLKTNGRTRNSTTR